MVLVRRRTGFVEELVRALKERGVPVAGVDRMVLTQQLSIMDLMALANFLLLPEDDLTLATILKSPLIGLTEEQLFDLAHPRKGTLWKALRTHAETGTDASPRPRLSAPAAERDGLHPPVRAVRPRPERPLPRRRGQRPARDPEAPWPRRAGPAGRVPVRLSGVRAQPCALAADLPALAGGQRSGDQARA